MKPLISVVIPIYGVEKYLKRAVDSVLHQTYTNLDIILVDDGSKDGCPAICDAYAAREARQKAEQKALEKEEKMQRAILDIKKKFGKNAILRGMNLEEGATGVQRNGLIGGHKG